MGVVVGFFFVILLLPGGDANVRTHYSLEPRYDEGQPLSTIHLHRQLAAISPNVSITATPNLLGANVSIIILQSSENIFNSP